MKIKLSILILLLAFLTLSFTGSPNSKSEKECTIYVKWYSASGKPAKGIKVVGYTTKHILSTEGTQIGYTDSSGKVKLRWDSYRDLYTIIVDGKSHEGSYGDGGTYTFVVD